MTVQIALCIFNTCISCTNVQTQRQEDSDKSLHQMEVNKAQRYIRMTLTEELM